MTMINGINKSRKSHNQVNQGSDRRSNQVNNVTGESKMDDKMLKIVAERFRALSDPSRLKIIQILRTGERSVGDLAHELNMRHGTVSRVLENAELVAKRKEGTKVFYRMEGNCVEKVCLLICSDVAHHLADRASLFRAFTEAKKPARASSRRKRKS